MKKYSGFTLIELMVALIIAGILFTVAGPTLKPFIEGSQIVSATNELLSAMHVARSEAIKSNGRVTICESGDGATCSATGSWKNGWIVFFDADGNGAGTGAACSAAGTDCLLRLHEGYDDSDITIAGLDPNGVDIQSFTFTSRGLPKNMDGSPQSGTFLICGDGGRAVVMSLSGRVRITENTAVMTCP